MYCPFCGEGALGAEARACPRCGAELWHPPAANAGMVVGDGGERAMSALAGRAALEWVLGNKGRLVLYGLVAAVAMMAVALAVITVVAALVALISALAPVIIIIAVLALSSRRRRRRRWQRRWIRY